MQAIIWKGIVSVSTIYATHYGSLKLYSHFCVPDGIWGFLTGSITAGSPLCDTALKVAQNTGITYTSAITVGLTRFILDLLTT